MKIIIKNTVFVLAIFALLANRCVKDSDEQTVDEEQAYSDALYNQKKEQTVADWSKFKKTADNLVAVARNNLNTLRVKESKAKGDAQANLDAICGNTDYDLTRLQEELEARDVEFAEELLHYDGSTAIKNNVFKNKFLHEMLELNTVLEEAIDE